MNRTFGYARVSSTGQNTDTQLDALQKLGFDRIFPEKISVLPVQCPTLDKILSLLRPGNTVVSGGRCRHTPPGPQPRPHNHPDRQLQRAGY